MKHYSIMKNEILEYLQIMPDGIYVDCTLGAGGHSSGILERLSPKGHLYGFDQDENARKIATERLNEFGTNYPIIPTNFVQLKQELAKYNIDGVDGILFDIGVSSMQLDEEERGFSYRYDARLDMRMNQEQELSAWDVVNHYEEAELARIMFEYGEEKFSRRIASNIVKSRNDAPIDTTFELIEIIRKSIPAKVQKQKHPAKKVFQAIRIEVNNELHVFEDALEQAFEILNPGGRIAVLTFHSLEDKICKNYFNKLGKQDGPQNEMERLLPVENKTEGKIITRKPVTANKDELKENLRSKSAKLRVIEKNKQ